MYGQAPNESGDRDGLTSIHGRIHCVATADADGEYSETDLIIINNFMSTLAEIALAVASRTVGQHTDDRD